ncbi:MAG: PIG-L family deacetylase [Acidimicrobiia bacterium]
MLVTSHWTRCTPTAPQHLIVAAPHPDDEVFGAGEIMRWAVSKGSLLTVVAVTDGEGSHGRSRRVSPEQLRRVRRAERAAALSVLGLAGHANIIELHVPDADVHRHVRDVACRLRDFVVDDRTVVCVPAAQDRHPDHRAVFEAGLLATEQSAVPLWSVPIWSRLDRPRPSVEAELVLDAVAEQRKRRAAACFRSQLVSFGPSAEDGPVLTAAELHGLSGGAEGICS